MVSTDVVTYKSAFGRVLAVVVGVLGCGALVAGLVTDAGATWPFVAPVLLVVVWVWAAYWRAALVVSPAGVEVRNVTRTVELPWPAIQSVETQYALTLVTAYGQYAAWAAPAPSRSSVASARRSADNLPADARRSGAAVRTGDLLNSASGQAAALIRARQAELADAGLLDDPRVEHQRPRVTWHMGTLATMGVLLVASVLTLVLR